MEQYVRSVVLQAWAAEMRQQAVEMRLRAISMRVFAQDMYTAPPQSSVIPSAPDHEGTAIDRWVRGAVVIEQATGLLAGRYHCSIQQASFLLREHSRRTNVPCAVLARQIVQRKGLAPPEESNGRD
ncbi:ANTAR domain-containing protein [Streptomyces sp. NPDC055243]|uniref:ANTAR domain-containing protein n=1 Tax=Streptomyces sp. NPDC055243 TaxID=3365720 RepID=UPI0037D28FD3